MLILIFTLSLFCIALLLHLIIWKIKVPNRELKVLFQVFLAVLVLGIMSLWILSIIILDFYSIGAKNFMTYLHISLSYITLMMAYIGNYPAIQVDSPTILIIMNIANAGPQGLSEDSLNRSMNDDFLIKPRIVDLLRARMIHKLNDKYTITKKGIIFIKPFVFYRKILNSHKGG